MLALRAAKATSTQQLTMNEFIMRLFDGGNVNIIRPDILTMRLNMFLMWKIHLQITGEELS